MTKYPVVSFSLSHGAHSVECWPRDLRSFQEEIMFGKSLTKDSYNLHHWHQLMMAIFLDCISYIESATFAGRIWRQKFVAS